MPKKCQGENTKAVVARARKAEKKACEKERLETEKADAYWKDDDKHVQKKNERKEEKEQKRLADIIRKKENKMLEESEKLELSAKFNPVMHKKVTAFQLQKNKEDNNHKETVTLSHLDMPLVENLNIGSEDIVSGSGIDGAINAIRSTEETEGPKISMSAAFKAFKEEKLPELKQKNPKLKLSQLNDIIRKEWQRSPRNPLNSR